MKRDRRRRGWVACRLNLSASAIHREGNRRRFLSGYLFFFLAVFLAFFTGFLAFLAFFAAFFFAMHYHLLSSFSSEVSMSKNKSASFVHLPGYDWQALRSHFSTICARRV
jgi:hypothetical protein